MSDDFKTCASPQCSACQEIRRLREIVGRIEALRDEWAATDNFAYEMQAGRLHKALRGPLAP